MWAKLKWHDVSTPLKGWNAVTSSVTPKVCRSLSGFLQDQVQNNCSSRWTAMMLRLLGAWIIDVRTGRGLSPIKQESNRRGWMGRRTGWNRTHVVPLSLTLRCYNYQIKVSVRASIFLCRVVHMEQLEVHQTKQKTSKAYKLLTHHFLLNHSWMHRCFLTWKHLHLWSNMWPQHQQCTVWVEAHCSTFEASQSFFFFFPVPSCPCLSPDAPPWHAQVCPLTYRETKPSLEHRRSSCSVAMDLD